MARKVYTIEDYRPFLAHSGESRTPLPLPNAEDVNPLWFLNVLASGGHTMEPVWGYALLPSEHRSQWTMFFLTPYMGGKLDGSGYAVTYGGARFIEGKSYDTPIVRRFAICRHEKEDGPGANHSRGWHPGRCAKCGMDMSYDSGD